MYHYNKNTQGYQRFGLILFSIGIALLMTVIVVGLIGTNQYQKEYSSNWKLAYKSATLEQKSMYIDKYVTALENSGFEGKHNALIFKTPDNSFDRNLDALKSLQTRLLEIQEMDPTTPEYNMAIYQITQQEQGEGESLNNTFAGIWWLNNYPLLWLDVCFWVIISLIITIFFGVRYWNYGNWE